MISAFFALSPLVSFLARSVDFSSKLSRDQTEFKRHKSQLATFIVHISSIISYTHERSPYFSEAI